MRVRCSFKIKLAARTYFSECITEFSIEKSYLYHAISVHYQRLQTYFIDITSSSCFEFSIQDDDLDFNNFRSARSTVNLLVLFQL